jgi:hypothetical protein
MNRLPRQVHRTKAVLKAAVHRTRIDQAGEPQLPNIAKPLKPGMPHQIIYQIIGQTDEPVDRVIDDFSPVCQTVPVLCPQIYSIVSKTGQEKLHLQHSSLFFRLMID